MVKCRIAYILILLVSFGFYLFYSDYLSFLALLFSLLLPVLLFILVLLASRKLSANLRLESSTAAKRDQIPVLIAIRNGFFLPLSRVKVNLQIENILNQNRKEFSLMIPVSARDTETISWTMSSEYCGQIRITMEKLTIYDYFGLFTFSKQPQQSQSVYILPEYQPFVPKVDYSNQIQLDSDIYSTTKPGDDSSETFGFRDYIPGDSPRSIHWKLSAKLDHMIIRQFSLPINSSYYILLELTKSPDNQDYVEAVDSIVDCTFSLSRFLLMNQMYHTVAWYNESLDALDQMTVTNENDLLFLLKKLLSASCCQKQSAAFERYLHLYSQRRSSHFFYLTSGKDLSLQCQTVPHLSNERTTILQFIPSSSPDASFSAQNKVPSENVSVLSVTGDTIKPILDQLVI